MGLTQSRAKEVAPHDVTVNAVCPGVVRTPLWDDPETEILRRLDGETGWQAYLDGIPWGGRSPPRTSGTLARTSLPTWPST